MQAIHPPSASSSLSGTSDNHVRAANNTPRSLFPPASGEGRVIGIDLRPMAPVPGVSFVLGDFSNAETQAALRQALGRDVGGDGMQLEEGVWKDGGGECEGTADVILSDMAPDLSGDKFRDHRRTLDLAYQVRTELGRSRTLSCFHASEFFCVGKYFYGYLLAARLDISALTGFLLERFPCSL